MESSEQPLEQQPMMPPFDATDPKYQVSDKFPPNKGSTWPHPPERSGWMMAHNSLRGSIDQFQDCLMAVKNQASSKSKPTPNNKLLQQWQVDCIRDIFDCHYEAIEEHHKTEDDILAPEFLKRFKYPAAKLCDDHVGIINQITKVKDMINKDMKAGDDVVTTMNELLTEFGVYSDALRPHFKEEEDIGLPLSRAYFTPKEFTKIMLSGHKNKKKATITPLRPEVLGHFVYITGTDEFRQFMKDEGVPSFVWYIAFKPGYNKYRKKILVKVDALKDGVEPVIVKRRGLFSCCG